LEQLMVDLTEQSTVEDLVEADIAFHQLLNSRCPNAYLTSKLEGLASATARARAWRGLTGDHGVDRTRSEHRRNPDALRGEGGGLAPVPAAARVGGVESRIQKAAEGVRATRGRRPRPVGARCAPRSRTGSAPARCRPARRAA